MCMASGSTPQGQTDTAGAAVGGAATGASMGAMLGPWGAAVGAVGGAAMGIIGSQQANKAAKATEENRRIAQEYAISENRKRATADYLNAIRMETVQAAQEHESVAERSTDITRQRDNTVGTAAASAAERGVDGRSLDQVIASYHMEADTEIGRLKANQRMKDRAHGESIVAADRGYYNRITGMQSYAPKQVKPVDYFSPIFGAVGDLGKIAMASGAGKNGGTVNTSTGAIDWETTPVNPEEYR